MEKVYERSYGLCRQDSVVFLYEQETSTTGSSLQWSRQAWARGLSLSPQNVAYPPP